MNDDPTMLEGDIGFSATIEQCLVVASCTIQYSSGAMARAGVTRAENRIPIANASEPNLLSSIASFVLAP